jgi:hypothetical protein
MWDRHGGFDKWLTIQICWCFISQIREKAFAYLSRDRWEWRAIVGHWPTSWDGLFVFKNAYGNASLLNSVIIEHIYYPFSDKIDPET